MGEKNIQILSKRKSDNALPEINASEIDTSINQLLATVCQERGIAMGVGSQRHTLESKN